MVLTQVNEMTQELSKETTQQIMNDLDCIESLLFLAVLYFIRDGFPLHERTMATVKWLVSLHRDVDGDFKTDLDIFALIFADNHGELHVAPSLFRVFQWCDADKQRIAVYSLIKRLEARQTPSAIDNEESNEKE